VSGEGYGALGQLTQKTLRNGTPIQYTYDRLNHTQAVTPSGGSTATTTYGYDAEHDQLTSINGIAVTTDANGNLANDGTNTYTWNASNQLSEVTPSGTLR
jgi:YD repeat-containing protein